MAKTKKNRRGLSDKVRQGKTSQEKKTNPFEIQINKQKHSVLGRKTKHDKGVPGVSRSKAMKKRKETLLKEYQQRNKSNRILDRRLGENDASLTPEEKMLKRFAFEKQRHHEKASVYNLNEDEELTHYGQSLAEIEKFEHPFDESDDEESGKLDAAYVAEEHFGGFLTKKKDSDKDDKPKSKKDLLEEKIAQSKKEKYDRQHEKEATTELREKLDADWKEISSLLGVSKRNKKVDTAREQPKVDDYDIAVRELAYDLKAKATDRLKTPEELAKEERERLERLEADRQKRMRGITEKEEKAEEVERMQHRSADDLGDDFEPPDREKFHVSYKEGKLVLPEGVESLQDLAKAMSEPTYKTSDDDDDDDDEEEEEEDDDDGDCAEDNTVEDEENNGIHREESDIDDDDDEEEEEEGDDDSGADLESDEEVDHDSEMEDDKMEIGEEDQSKQHIKSQDPSTDRKDRQAMIEEAKKELPYTFPAPSSYDDLLSLVTAYDSSQQMMILERVRKCHHPSLAEGNKGKLETLFSLLVEYFGDLACERPLKMDLIDGLIRHLYELCQQFPEKAALVMHSVIVEKFEDFDGICEQKGIGKYPGLDTLLYFKLVSLLFPTSDFSHIVVTPTVLFMSQILTHCQPMNCKDVAAGLFVCSLFLQYVSLSRRYVPEALNYLRGVLSLATTEENATRSVVQPFKPSSKYNDLLVLHDSSSAREIDPAPLSITAVLGSKNPVDLRSDSFIINALAACLCLLQQFSELYEALPSYREIFRPVTSALMELNVEAYPQAIKELVTNLLQQISNQDKKPRKFLAKEKKKPTSIKFFEPKVEEDYDMDSKRKSKSKKMSESQKLLHKHRREMKGAIREIRKDAQFIARQKLQDQLERDTERKQKLRELYHMLGTQEGDFKRLERRKGKFT